MDRIDDPSKQADKFGVGKAGFTNGDPGLVDPTAVPAEWLDGVQEEIIRAIEAGGLTPDAGDLGQLSAVLQNLQNYAVRYDCNASGLASGSKFTIDGPFVGDGGDTSFFPVSSNEIVVPANGVYLISLDLELKDLSSSSNPQALAVLLTAGSATYTMTALRHSATTGDHVCINATRVEKLSASDHIHVKSQTSNLTSAGSSQISVALLRRTG